ncbi:DEAD/DEAH box helicase [Saccharococcus thermophilus]|uniref:DEAD/DEAH box helicase n=1 Tax=Saccharococcus thermophilus TaxID=29396 RepID=UPI001ABA4D90|nr:DEAD/DEAH box helicase family protein [Saccharococcus thermophilus]
MLIKDVWYQNVAVNELLSYTKQLLNNGEKNSLIIFKAPTGSGKTVMAAKFIKKCLKELEGDYCFIWISIGKGDLHLQSKAKLEKIFQGYPMVSLLEKDYFGWKKEIDNKEIVVVNWEKIRDKDSETDEWANILMRDGEKLNFRDVLANTRETGRKIILIIDESHIGKGTTRTEEIKKEVNPDIILEMSATPKIPSGFKEHVANGKAGYVEVDIKDVIDAGMIKKKLVVNEGLNKRDDMVMDLELLELAFAKRNELKKALEQEDSDVNPLVIIQLPNSEEGNIKKEFVIQSLREKGITIENRKLAIWLSDEEDKVNLETITSNTDTVEFLLFKQAIDTGWDCPRASILLKYRETSSETFERQTLGRILRMPEQKHYENDVLNKAYVYTDYIGSVLNIIDEDFDFPDENINDIPLIAKGYENITLVTQKIKRKKKDVVKEALVKAFNEIINEKGLVKLDYSLNKELLKINDDLSQLTEKIIAQIEIETEDILQKEQIKGTEVEFQLDDFRTQRLFDKLLKKHSNAIGNDKNYMFNLLKENIYSLIAYYVTDIYKLRNMLIDAQRIFILNYESVFSKLISDVLAKYKELKEDDQIETTFGEPFIYTIPERDNVNSITYEKVDIGKYFYSECYLEKGRSKPERSFEKYLKNNLNIIRYWVKNGDNGSKYFSIPYQIKGKYSDFYPDYIVVFEDGRIGLFETKDKLDDSQQTKAKAEALYEYIHSVNSKGDVELVGGIVANFGTEEIPYLKINRNKNYSTKQNEWDDLDNVFMV